MLNDNLEYPRSMMTSADIKRKDMSMPILLDPDNRKFRP